jgi:putative endonuclease
VECSDGTFYTGWTTDTGRRLKEHNAGRGARYTSMRRPVKLVYIEPQTDRITAMKRERAIKALPRKKKQELIEGRPTRSSHSASVPKKLEVAKTSSPVE